LQTVYTGGTFDLFHAGHVNLLKKCRELAGRDGKVIVSLNSDEFILEYKGASPVCNFEERKAVLDACRYVDEVVENIGGRDSKPAILATSPNIIAIGSDWENRDYFGQMNFTPEWLSHRNIRLVYVPYTSGISSSAIKQRVI
jgi:glycerol-3-phosphate cytidylyltransferase